MNLLQATEILIEVARERAPDDKLHRAAIKRMEKRLRVLKVRDLKAVRRRRWNGWHIALCLTARQQKVEGTIATYQSVSNPICNGCAHELTFREFVRNAELRRRGYDVDLECPRCGYHMLGYNGLHTAEGEGIPEEVLK